MQQLRRDQCRRWDAPRALLLGELSIRVGIDVYLVPEELRQQDVVVGSVAEGIKSLVWVFDSQLRDCWVLEACGVNGGVEMSPMSRALVRRQNQELSDSQPSRQLSRSDLRCWEWIVHDGAILCSVSLVEPPAISCRISDNGILGGCWRGRFHFLIASTSLARGKHRTG